jgi:superfamily II DNA or RNA helicase
MEEKKCTVCGQIKSLSEFNKQKLGKNGYRAYCRECQCKTSKEYTFATSYFDIKPFHYQSEILEKLEVERSVHNRYRNLLVAATGTGKTVISAFDYKNFRNNNQSSKLLFVAHRKEILQQAKATFQGVLKENNFGDLWVDGIEPNSYEYVFASIQTPLYLLVAFLFLGFKRLSLFVLCVESLKFVVVLLEGF